MADHIVYRCVSYRYMTGWEGVTSAQITTPASDDITLTGPTTSGADRVVVVVSAGEIDDAGFVGSTGWGTDDADVTGISFHVWCQTDVGHGGGMQSGAGQLAAAGPSGTWTNTWASPTVQVNMGWAIFGTQPPEVYDSTTGSGADNVAVSEPIYGGGFYLVIYAVSDEPLEVPAGWTEVFSEGTGTPGTAGAVWLTILAADADDSPTMPTLTYAAASGDVLVDADTADATATAFDATPAPGAVTAAADFATATWAAQDAAAAPGAVSPASDFATVTWAALDAAAAPGAVSLAADTAEAAAAAFDVTADALTLVDADDAAIAAAAFDVAAAPGAVTVAADLASTTIAAFDATPTTATLVDADTAIATAAALDAAAAPGPVSPSADLAESTVLAFDGTPVVGAVAVAVDFAAITLLAFDPDTGLRFGSATVTISPGRTAVVTIGPGRTATVDTGG